MAIKNVKLTGQRDPRGPVEVEALTSIRDIVGDYQLFHVGSATGPENHFFEDARKALEGQDVLAYPVPQLSSYEKFLLNTGVSDSKDMPLELELSGDVIRNIKTSNILEKPAILNKESYAEFAVRGVRAVNHEKKNPGGLIDPFEAIKKQSSRVKTAYKKPEVVGDEKELTLGQAWRSYLRGKKE